MSGAGDIATAVPATSGAPVMGRGEWGLLLILSVFWGSSYLLNKLALPGFPALTLVWIRVTLAAGLLWLFLRARRERLPRGWAAWRGLIALALFNTVLPLSLFSAAQTVISASLASIMNGMTPILAVVTAHFLTQDEKATPARVVGVLFGFAGLVVVIGMEAMHGVGGHLLAQCACLLASLCNALAGIYGRRITQTGVSPLALAVAQLVLSSVLTFPAAMIVDRPWTLPMPTPTEWLAMLGLTVFSTALAFALFFKLLARAGVTNALLVTFLLPVVAIFEGVLVLGEQLEPQHGIGLLLIAAGLVAVDGRVPRRLWRVLRPAPV